MENKNVKAVVFAVALLIVIAVIIVLAVVLEKPGNTNGGIVVGESGSKSNVIFSGDGTIVNISENINKEVIKVEDFDLTDVSLIYEDGMTQFNAKVNNNSSVDYPLGASFVISFYDAAGNLMHSVPALTSTLIAGGYSSINANLTTDCTSASDIRIDLLKED